MTTHAARTIAAWAVLGGFVFAVTLAGGRRFRRERQQHPGNEYQPSFRRPDGNQLVMIYFGSSHCAWSTQQELPGLVQGIERTLDSTATSRHMGFEAIGVALDWSWSDGVDHLRHVGAFDEISAGYDWSNRVAMTYFGKSLLEPEVTPEIVVALRQVRRPDLVHTFTYSVISEQVVTTKEGVSEIEKWVKNGAPIPDLSPQTLSAH